MSGNSLNWVSDYAKHAALPIIDTTLSSSSPSPHPTPHENRDLRARRKELKTGRDIMRAAQTLADILSGPCPPSNSSLLPGSCDGKKGCLPFQPPAPIVQKSGLSEGPRHVAFRAPKSLVQFSSSEIVRPPYCAQNAVVLQPSLPLTTPSALPLTPPPALPSTTPYAPSPTPPAAPPSSAPCAPSSTIPFGPSPTTPCGPSPTIPFGPSPTTPSAPSPTTPCGPSPTTPSGPSRTIPSAPPPSSLFTPFRPIPFHPSSTLPPRAPSSPRSSLPVRSCSKPSFAVLPAPGSKASFASSSALHPPKIQIHCHLKYLPQFQVHLPLNPLLPLFLFMYLFNYLLSPFFRILRRKFLPFISRQYVMQVCFAFAHV